MLRAAKTLVTNKASGGHALEPRGPRSATPRSRGRAPKPPSYADGSILSVSSYGPDWNNSTARAQPSPFWRIPWPGRFPLCDNASPRVMWPASCRDEGGGPVSSRPRRTAIGGPCAATLAPGATTASGHAHARRGRSPCALPVLRDRLPLLWTPAVSHPCLDCSWHARSRVSYHRQHKAPSASGPSVSKGVSQSPTPSTPSAPGP